jgi:predicted alpha/beta hydrolase
LKAETIANSACVPPFTIPAEWRPAEQARAAILLVPAMGTPARYYEPFAAACAVRGFHTLLPELPGTGASLPRPSRSADYGYADLIERFLPPLVEAVRSRAGALPLVVAGHSLGAHAAMLATLRNRIAVTALVTLAGGDIHYRNWSGNGAGRVLLMAWIVAGLSCLPGAVPGRYLGLGGPQARTLMREWSRIIRDGSFERVAGNLPRGAAVPSLCVAFEGDFMAPGASVAALADRLGGELRQLPVDWPGNPHASWARHPHATLRAIDDWLVERGLVSTLRGTTHET